MDRRCATQVNALIAETRDSRVVHFWAEIKSSDYKQLLGSFTYKVPFIGLCFLKIVPGNRLSTIRIKTAKTSFSV